MVVVAVIDDTPPRRSYAITAVSLSVCHSMSKITHERVNRCRPNMVDMGKGDTLVVSGMQLTIA